MSKLKQLKDNRRFRGAALALFVLTLIGVTVQLTPMITQLISDPQAFRTLVRSYGAYGALVYIGFMVLQIFIAIIPGEIIQIAGGYLFGTVLGSVLSLLGAVLGTVLTFYAARIVGFGYLKLVMDPVKLKRFSRLINSPKAEAVLFLLFLVPGVPKDMLVYAAGVTPIKPSVFIVLSILARTPAIIGAALIGSHMQKQNYIVVILISVVSVILFGLGYYYKDRLIERLHAYSHHHHYHRHDHDHDPDQDKG